MGGAWELLAWLVVGIAAGLADYWLGMGFGLAASILLAGIAGYDPRVVAGSAAVAQVLTVLPVYAANRATGVLGERDLGDSLGVVVVLSASSSLAALVAAFFSASLPPREARVLYAALLALLAMLVPISTRNTGGGENRGRGRGSGILALLGALGFAAGVLKAVVGGGYTAVLVAAKTIAGIDARKAVALTPLTKTIPFTVIGLVYMYAGYTNPYYSLTLAAGGTLASPLAAQALRKTSPAWIGIANTIILAFSSLLVLWRAS